MKNTRGNILAAARELFERRGFAAATTKDIAALARVSEVTLFRHFPTKRALFDETLHSCLHPYTVEEYLKSGVTYDLERDLQHIARDLRESFQKNAPMLRMIMRDKVRDSMPEKDIRDREHNMRASLIAYFGAMASSGALSAPPEMAMEFFMTNVTGSIMKEMMGVKAEDDGAYFNWMLGQVIGILKTGKDKI